MGRDITPICKHNLNTKNVKTLAEDLFNRLDINVEYPSDDVLVFTNNRKHVEFGTESKIQMIKDESFDTYLLTDEKHNEKLFIEYYDGLNELNRQEYWNMFFGYSRHIPSNKEIEEEKHALIFNTYELSCYDENDYKYLQIYNHCVHIHIPYLSRWWDLCRIFSNHNQDEFWNTDYFIDYRKSLKYYSYKLGDTKIYLLDDQSDVMEGVGQGCEWDMTWEEIEKHILEKSGDLLLDISEFITNESYRNSFVYHKNYPLAFVDNFKDLE